MIRFILGMMAVLAAVGIVAACSSGQPVMAVWLVMPALLGCVAGVELGGLRRPVRWFDPRVRRSGAVLAVGVLAGLVAAVADAMAAAWADGPFQAGVLVAVSALVCAAMAMRMMPRVYAGDCVCCGYDLAGSAVRCPECGGVGTRV